jgi:plastocyanin
MIDRPSSELRGVVRLLIAAMAVLLILPSPPAWAGQQVMIEDNDFVPAVVRVTPGGQVDWVRAAGSAGQHNVDQDAGLFRSGAPTFGPINYTITVSAGTYPYECEIHGPTMAGVVKGRIKVLDAPAGRTFTVQWATDLTDTGSVFDVGFKVGTGDWRGWKTNTSDLEDVFGQDGDPVTVRADKTYKFRARSQEGTDVSGWSPIRTVRT